MSINFSFAIKTEKVVAPFGQKAVVINAKKLLYDHDSGKIHLRDGGNDDIAEFIVGQGGVVAVGNTLITPMGIIDVVPQDGEILQNALEDLKRLIYSPKPYYVLSLVPGCKADLGE